jgi:hypothetical protein
MATDPRIERPVERSNIGALVKEKTHCGIALIEDQSTLKAQKPTGQIYTLAIG